MLNAKSIIFGKYGSNNPNNKKNILKVNIWVV